MEHGQIGVQASRFQRDEEQAAEAVTQGRRAPAPLAGSNRGEIDDDPVERSSLPSLPELDHRATRSRRGDQLVVMVSSSRTSVECWACPGGAQPRRGSSLLPSLTDHFL